MIDNTKEALKQQQKTKNAIDFIRESSLYTDPRHVWIQPLVEKVLSDNFFMADIKTLVDKINPSEESTPALHAKNAEKIITTCTPLEIETLRRIKSIDLIANIGLVSRDKPIELNNDLNIFYGQNGSGKSSFYLALCKTIQSKGDVSQRDTPSTGLERKPGTASVFSQNK